MPEFIPGLRLSHDYYHEVVAPMVAEVLPGTRHAAGLIGDGSEVLGYDTERSRDHDWGPRVQLFFDSDRIGDVRQLLTQQLASRLPAEFRGWTTQYRRGRPSELSGPGRPDEIVRGVEIHDVRDWTRIHLGLDVATHLTTRDWLAFPWCLLRGATGGAIWRDDGVGITAVRDLLRWYPDDLWRYIVACQWQRVNQEEPFVARAAEVGAELGSQIIAMRQVREIMHLCFLLERSYPPYSKWLDTAFQALGCAADIRPSLLEASAASDIAARERALGRAYVSVANLHNRSGVSAPEDSGLQQFYDRPYRVLNAFRFVEATRAAITDAELRELPLHGSISQCVDSTDVLASGAAAHRFAAILGSRVTGNQGSGE
jgi:hypothetical protein